MRIIIFKKKPLKLSQYKAGTEENLLFNTLPTLPKPAKARSRMDITFSPAAEKDKGEIFQKRALNCTISNFSLDLGLKYNCNNYKLVQMQKDNEFSEEILKTT